MLIAARPTMPRTAPLRIPAAGNQAGSLQHFEKGGVEVIKDDARNYVFSNIFEVTSGSAPYERVAVGNLKLARER